MRTTSLVAATCLAMACATTSGFDEPGEKRSKQATARLEFREKAKQQKYERIVNEFILYDTGRIRDPVQVNRIRREFNTLRSSDALPALVKGLNYGTRIRASCPITALSDRISDVLRRSEDPSAGAYVLRNLAKRNVGRYNYRLSRVFKDAERQMIKTQGKEIALQNLGRRAESDRSKMTNIPGRKLQDLSDRPFVDALIEQLQVTKPGSRPKEAKPAKSKSKSKSAKRGPRSYSSRTLTDLIDSLKNRRDAALVLQELFRRANGKESSKVVAHSKTMITALGDADPAVRIEAVRVCGLLRLQPAVPKLIDLLEDSSPPVRSAAATSLARTTRKWFGPRDGASEPERTRAIAQWREWYRAGK